MGLQLSDLTPVLAQQPGVCQVCHGWARDYPACWQCHTSRGAFGLAPFPAVLPLALAVHDGPLAFDLWRYKNAQGLVQIEAIDHLRWLVNEYAAYHQTCLMAHQGIDRFDLVTWVPSARFPGEEHPMLHLLTGSRLTEGGTPLSLIKTVDARPNEHRFDPRRYDAWGNLQGANVLLVDDTWTSGGSALSAAHALIRDAEADVVSILTLGRHFTTNYRESHVYSSFAKEVGFDPQWCTYCDPRPRANPPLPNRVPVDEPDA